MTKQHVLIWAGFILVAVILSTVICRLIWPSSDLAPIIVGGLLGGCTGFLANKVSYGRWRSK